MKECWLVRLLISSSLLFQHCNTEGLLIGWWVPCSQYCHWLERQPERRKEGRKEGGMCPGRRGEGDTRHGHNYFYLSIGRRKNYIFIMNCRPTPPLGLSIMLNTILILIFFFWAGVHVRELVSVVWGQVGILGECTLPLSPWPDMTYAV